MIIALTVPLALSYPNPKPEAGVPARRLTYTLLGAGEAALGTVLAVQFMAGDSGISDNFLIAGTGIMGALCAMRGFFLFVIPNWIEAQGNARKVK